MDSISLDEFNKAEIRIGTVRSAELVPATDKLLRLEVDFGDGAPRQILSGIAEHVEPSILVGRQFPFITNLEPRVIRGLVSNGMLLAVIDPDHGFALLSPTRPISAGSRVR